MRRTIFNSGDIETIAEWVVKNGCPKDEYASGRIKAKRLEYNCQCMSKWMSHCRKRMRRTFFHWIKIKFEHTI